MPSHVCMMTVAMIFLLVVMGGGWLNGITGAAGC
jgi:hypothetical protein